MSKEQRDEANGWLYYSPVGLWWLSYSPIRADLSSVKQENYIGKIATEENPAFPAVELVRAATVDKNKE